MKAFFISDLHLKDSNEPSSKILLGFLIQLENSLKTTDPATHLFLVGDIFDLWIASHTFFIEKFKAIVDQLKLLKSKGLEIHYFEGNHDLYLKDFWQETLGMTVHSKAAHFRLGKLHVRVEHGDLINPEDKGYLFLYSFLRTQSMSWLAKNLPSSLVKLIGTKASSASREYTSVTKHIHQDKMRELIKDYVLGLKGQKFELFVSGHVHIQDDQILTKAGSQVRCINLGSWFDFAKCFILSDSEAQFFKISPSGEIIAYE